MRLLPVSILICSFLIAPAMASDDQEPYVEPMAKEVMGMVREILMASDGYVVRAETTIDHVTEGGHKIKYGGVHQLAYRKPDRVKMISKGDLADFYVWYNGERVARLDIETMRYASVEAPATAEETFMMLADKYGLTFPMNGLIHADPIGHLAERVKHAVYMGVQKVRGKDCHHVGLVLEGDLDLQIWVEMGLVPVMRKAVLTIRSEPTQPQFIMYYTDWQFNPFLPDAIFDFVKPKGAILELLEEYEEEMGKEKAE